MPLPLILSEIPAAPQAADVSLHAADSASALGMPAAGEGALRPDTLPVPLTSAETAARVERTDSNHSTDSTPTAFSLLLSPVPSALPSKTLLPAVGIATPTPGSPVAIGFVNPGFSLKLAQTVPAAPVVGSDSSSSWTNAAFPSKTRQAQIGPTPSPSQPAQAAPLSIRADAQSYDQIDQVVSAYGNVQVQFGDAQLLANRLWVNLGNRYIRAEDDVLLTRGNQALAGSQITYNLVQGAGSVLNARGELALNEFEQDFSTGFRLLSAEDRVTRPIDQQILGQGSISAVTSPGGISFSTETRPLAGTENNDINRLRFEANRIDFDASGWQAEGVRLTNDPFSPPDIEFRGDTARLSPISASEDELVITNARVVFDQSFSIPLLRDRITLQRGQVDPNELNPIPTAIGIDGRDRDGLYIERPFPVYADSAWRLTLTPQFNIGRWLGQSASNLGDAANFGLVANLDGILGPRTRVTALASLSGLDLANYRNRLRASVRGQQLVGDHQLNFEYSFRDRLYNGSLGFQDVQSSLGAVLLSPLIQLGDTQITLSYQVSGQYVTAVTDRANLLGSNPTTNLVSLFRGQVSASLSRGFMLWQGKGLPATPTEGLRYSPRPVVPYIQLVTGVRGTTTYYSSNDLQEILTASIGIVGQFGNFSRDYLDYTQFNLIYSKAVVGGNTSPFLFDRNVDQNVLSGGLIQQIYGPFRAGFQTSLNLDNGRLFDTELVFEYSRRAYGLVLRYNPSQSTGYIGFRLSDFDWVGRTAPFDAVTP